MRLPVQLVLRPDDSFRGLAGTLTAGTIAVGDRVRVAPSGRTSSVARLVTLEGDLSEAHATEAVTVVLADEVDVARGDVLCPTDAPVEIADMFHARVVWMDDLALVAGRPYLVKLAASTVGAVFSWPHHRIDVATGAEVSARTLALNEIGTVDVTFDRPVAFETYECSRHLGGFIVIDRVSGATVGAGMILHARRRANEVHWQASSVDRVARERLGGHRGALVWFTGLSGAGKSTVADLVERRLHQLGMRTYLLDGDNLRHGLNADLGFQPADRIENIRRVGEVGRLMVDAGLVVLASFISPYASDRAMVRQRLGQDFIEVFVDAPLAVCEARDPKGLYARARRGELADFTGIDAPYEAPEHPEIRLDTARLSAIEAAEMVVAAVQARSER
jgi:bifunctional enzyme CysN/CysC